MNVPDNLLILGAGGHAKVVADAARAMGIAHIYFCDEGAGQSLEQFAGICAHIHVAIGDNATRDFGYKRAIEEGFTPYSVVHPTAIISPEALIGQGVYIGALCVLNPQCSISDFALINTGAIVEHDSVVGQAAFIAPGAIMCGRTGLGARSFLGTHGTMIPQTSVGDDVVIGAGSVVTRTFENDVHLVGVPARVLEKKGDKR